jgi:predicted permease
LLVFGRLGDGVGVEQAQAEMNLIAKRLQEEYPNSNEDIGVRVGPYATYFTSRAYRTLFLAMLGAVGFVLLIACANVANLLLSRSLARGREASIRAALGASRGRIVQQLLIESLLLGVLGTIGGLILSIWGVRSFAATLSWRDVPYWVDFSMDYTVFLYVAAICLVTTVLFGLAPALHASKVDLSTALKEGARGSGGGRTRYLSQLLVVSEVSLALILLVGAGLMVRSFVNLYRLGTGSENEKVLTMRINFNGRIYLEPEPRIKVLEELEPELWRTPGVESVAIASSLPQDWAMPWQFDLEGQAPPADPDDRPLVAGVEISSEYFHLLGVPLLRGRNFQPNEGRSGAKVAIVNQRFAARYWPEEDPVGKRINIVRFDKSEQWVTVVGEVADVKHKTWPNPNESEMEPTIYVPYLQDQEGRWIAVLASTRGDPHSLAVPLRDAIQRVAELASLEVMTLPEHAARQRWFTSLYGSLFAIFAFIGIVLAGVGIYAVMSYSVSQRTQEIGIRMALGAQRFTVVKLVLAQGLRLAAIGVLTGLLGSFALTRVMERLLVGVQPTDPTTFIAVALLLTTIALIACYLPARRATAVDPMLALRSE